MINIPANAIDYHLPVAPGVSANLIDVSALAHSLFQLLEQTTQDPITFYETSYDRTLAGLLRIAIYTTAVIDRLIDSYDDGVFSYECLELTDDGLPMFIWSRLSQEDIYQVAEYFVVPEALGQWVVEWVEGWLAANPDCMTLKEGALQ